MFGLGYHPCNSMQVFRVLTQKNSPFELSQCYNFELLRRIAIYWDKVWQGWRLFDENVLYTRWALTDFTITYFLLRSPIPWKSCACYCQRLHPLGFSSVSYTKSWSLFRDIDGWFHFLVWVCLQDAFSRHPLVPWVTWGKYGLVVLSG